mgnify:CR=1 FL=1|jgi:disulfide bond formation protein DsbB
MLRSLWNIRAINFIAFASTIIALLVAIFYFQGYLGLTACPLCIFQRIGMLGAGAFFLLAAIQGPGQFGLRVYALIGLIPSLFGAGIAARHIWIQSLPADKVPACGPDLAYMMEAFPFQKMITTVLRGSGECAEVQWSLLGLSIPGWVLVVFAVMIIFQLLQLWKGDFTR